MFWNKKISDTDAMRYGFLAGIGQAAYCLVVIVFINNIAPMMPVEGKSIGSGLLFLLVFCFSAAISGLIVLGYPAFLAMKNRFIEAVMTVCTTLATLAICGILLFLLLLFV